VVGQVSDRLPHSRKQIVLGGLSIYTLTLCLLVDVVPIQSPFCFGLLFFLMGFFNSFGMVVFTHVKELFPITISGTATALTNFFSMGGGAVFMPALGKIIESYPISDHTYPAKAYQLAFLSCFLSMVACLIFYSFSKKEKKDSLVSP